MRGLPSILSLVRNKFNKCNNTAAGMLDDIKITLKSYFWGKKVIIASLLRPYDSRKSENHLWFGLSILLHGVISLPDALSYDTKGKLKTIDNLRAFNYILSVRHHLCICLKPLVNLIIVKKSW